MGTTSSGSKKSSAGRRYSAVVSLYSAHTGTRGTPSVVKRKVLPLSSTVGFASMAEVCESDVTASLGEAALFNHKVMSRIPQSC